MPTSESLTPDSVFRTVRELAAEIVRSGAEELPLDVQVSHAGLDSLAFIELVVAVEDRLGRRVNVAQMPAQVPADASVAEMLAIISSGFVNRS